VHAYFSSDKRYRHSMVMVGYKYSMTIWHGPSMVSGWSQYAGVTLYLRAGAVPINWFAVACELQSDWRDDGDRLLNIVVDHLPPYNNLVLSKG
jgi:hypothetical protein